MKGCLRAWACGCLFFSGCGKPESPAPASKVAEAVAVESKRVYRCEWSPLIDYEAEDFEDVLTSTKDWRVAADGVTYDSEAYDGLGDLIEKVPAGSEDGLPFSGFNEHFLLCEGSAKGTLIGFVADNHGMVVWEMEVDEEGRWQKTDLRTRLGTEADKAAVRALVRKIKFGPL